MNDKEVPGAVDEIIGELRRAKVEVAREFGNSVRAICSDLKTEELERGQPPVRLEPRPPKRKPQAA